MALVELHYFSQALLKQTAAYVILPEKEQGPYPTLYLLHGLSDDHTIWLRRTSIERYVADLPLIVVMPDGGRGFCCDAEEGFQFGTALGVELVDRIDRTFPTKAERTGRALAGLSMGGYGSLRLALTYPDRFAAAVSHSGALGFGNGTKGHDGNPYTPEFQRILGPDPTGGPNDLFALVEAFEPDNLPAMRIDCGTEDFLIEPNRRFHAHLENLKISHEYEEHPGAHTWDYWDLHIQDTLKFLKGKLDL
ncbi:MAG: hypothetical protein OHK0029_39470 [Armatimonadaceae bacterium]